MCCGSTALFITNNFNYVTSYLANSQKVIGQNIRETRYVQLAKYSYDKFSITFFVI